jgi:hypothetical protein
VLAHYWGMPALVGDVHGTNPPRWPGIHPSRKFWWSRHTSVYRNSLNLETSGRIVLYTPGKRVVIDGNHR